VGTCREGQWISKNKKARLVVRICSQRGNIDVVDTYSPTRSKESLRIVLAISASNNLKFNQIDVQTAFSNLIIDKEILIELLQLLYPDS
jgi:Reverse transcriptase (RNA-dependent DNA polymerase)